MDAGLSECCQEVAQAVKRVLSIGRPNVLTDNTTYEPQWLPLYQGLLARKALDRRGLGSHGRRRLLRRCAEELGIEVEHRLLGLIGDAAAHAALKVGCAAEHAVLALIKADAMMPQGTPISLMKRFNDHHFVLVEDVSRKEWVVDSWTEGQSGNPYGVGLYCFDGLKNRRQLIHRASGRDGLGQLLDVYCETPEFLRALSWAEEKLMVTLQDIDYDPQTYAGRLGVSLYAKPY